ncbi:MAG TPA: cation diffusion facilitator family transporter [Patescibacteria group bacterium]|nr:cation diffusion facilitator family transporter [Patescibacteria group bacterium]
MQKKERAALLSVASNSLLTLSKIVVGVMTGALSVLSEAAHSGVDLLASLIAYYSVRQSGKPADLRHPYGHGKIENLSAAVEALLIVLAAIWIIWEAMHKLKLPGEVQAIDYGIVAMVLSIIMNVLVSRYLFKVARETESPALEADALHLQADIWTSLGVLTGLVAIKITGFLWLDPMIAIVVALFIFKAGYDMTKSNVADLMDSGFCQSVAEVLAAEIDRHPEVVGYRELRTRRGGKQKFVDITLQFTPEISLKEAHRVSHEMEIALRRYFTHLDMVIHLEPIEESGKGTLP